MRLAVASGKGGTGKTLVATNLAWNLAARTAGVTYVDADVEAPNGHLFFQPTFNSVERHTVRVPSLGGGSVSVNATELGWSAGLDTGSGAMMIPFYGGEVCGYLGLTGSSMILHPEHMILQHEACQDAYDLLHGFEFDEADMALDVIAKVGPRSHFLAQKHTRKHIRDFRLPSLEREDAEGNPRDPQEVALEEFKRLNETHRPRPLPDEVLAELDRILAAAEREVEELG